MAQKEKILAKAQKFLEKGSIDKAAAEYKAAVAIDPSDVMVRLRLEDLYRKLGNKREFLEYSHALLNIYKDDPDKRKAVCESILSVVPTDAKAIDILGEGRASESALEAKPFLAAPISAPSPAEPLVEFPSIGVPSGKPEEEPLIDFPSVGVSGAESAKEEEPVTEFPKVEEVLEDIELSFESPVEEISVAGEEKEESVSGGATALSAEKEAATEIESEEFFEINIEPPGEEEIAPPKADETSEAGSAGGAATEEIPPAIPSEVEVI